MKPIVRELQQRLATLGHDPGTLDGELGAATYAAFLDALVKRPLGPVGLDKGKAFVSLFPRYDLMTPRRQCHFTAQCAHETGGYRYFTELGADAYFTRYDGRTDLGNTQRFDGARFRGRGDFQITGRKNYTTYGARIGVDLVAHPELAAQSPTATELACLYWQDHALNTLADGDDLTSITQRINGGQNGAAERRAYLVRAQQLWNI